MGAVLPLRLRRILVSSRGGLGVLSNFKLAPAEGGQGGVLLPNSLSFPRLLRGGRAGLHGRISGQLFGLRSPSRLRRAHVPRFALV